METLLLTYYKLLIGSDMQSIK